MRCVCLALILLAAALRAAPQKPRRCAPARRRSRRRRPRATRRARSTTCRAGASAQLEPSLRAFLAGCARLAGAAQKACELAQAVPPGDEAAARQFFESEFAPYALVSSDEPATAA